MAKENQTGTQFTPDAITTPRPNFAQSAESVAGTSFGGDAADDGTSTTPEAEPLPASGEPITDEEAKARATGLEPKDTDGITSTRDLLHAQKKIMVMLQQAPSDQPQLPSCVVTINGYSYVLARGVGINVPISIYEMLVSSGEIPAQRAQDFILQPYNNVPNNVEIQRF